MLEKVNEKIRQIRELKNISQEHIARGLNISTRAYSKIESGETQLTISRLNEISKIIQVDPKEVLGFNTENIFNNGLYQQGGKAENVIYHQTEIKQVRELYERLLAEKERCIKILEKKLKI